jgi:hypothetical protein
MHRRVLAALSLGALSVCPVWSGCAEQLDSEAQRSSEATGATAAVSGSGGETAGTTAGIATGGKLGTAGSTANGGGVSGSGGTAAVAGNGPGAADGGAATAGGGAGGEGGESGCKVAADCDDGNPCTTEDCLIGHCSKTSNTTACADDKDPCTADICAVGLCTHPDNKLCECKKDADCADDKNVCTDDHCTANKCEHLANTAPCDDKDTCTTDTCANKACSTHVDNGSCGVGKAFTVDSFNSSADWLAATTTPDLRAIVVTGVNSTNLEGNADLWIAEADTGTIEFALASMVGLAKVRVVIRSTVANTGGMVFVGLWNGTAWSDKALSAYAAIPVGNYATIEVPTADFGQQLADVTKLRLRFAVTGGEKTWQIDELSAAK